MMMMETKTTTTTTKIHALKKNKTCIWSKTGQKNTRKRMQIVLLSCVSSSDPLSPSSPAFGPFICTSEESRISNNDEKLLFR